MSYQIIESNGEVGAVEPVCRALGVSVSGYYAWRNRAPSQHQQDDATLLKHIRTAYQTGRGLYGSPRIHVALRQAGVCCSRKRVARLADAPGGYSLASPPETARADHRQPT